MDELHLKISGQVQGVSFRYQTQIQAQKLGLTGWIKNAPDGIVELVAQGDKASLEGFIKWCKTGPEYASVSHIDQKWRESSEKFLNFEITR